MSVWVLFIFLKMLFWMKAVFFMRLLLVFNQVFIWISDSVIAGSHCGALSEKELLFSHSVVSDSFETTWTIAHQAPLSMEFSRQEYWGGLPLPSPGYRPDPGIKPRSPALQTGSLLCPWPHLEAQVGFLPVASRFTPAHWYPRSTARMPVLPLML